MVFERIFSNPAASGIENVTEPCLAGDASFGGTSCPDPNAHLFWDTFRPTMAGHKAIASAALPGRDGGDLHSSHNGDGPAGRYGDRTTGTLYRDGGCDPKPAYDSCQPSSRARCDRGDGWLARR